MARVAKKKKQKSYYKPKGTKKTASAALIAEVRAQVIKELKDKEAEELARLEEERRVQQTAHKAYLEQMYASAEPWVELQSWANTPQGVKVELEWNNAFVAYLKEQGITGTDDDQVVQKWVALLLMQVNDSMENPPDKDSKFE